MLSHPLMGLTFGWLISEFFSKTGTTEKLGNITFPSRNLLPLEDGCKYIFSRLSGISLPSLWLFCIFSVSIDVHQCQYLLAIVPPVFYDLPLDHQLPIPSPYRAAWIRPVPGLGF